MKLLFHVVDMLEEDAVLEENELLPEPEEDAVLVEVELPPVPEEDAVLELETLVSVPPRTRAIEEDTDEVRPRPRRTRRSKQSIFVQEKRPSLQEQELHQSSPSPSPRQPLGTVSPLARVQLLSCRAQSILVQPRAPSRQEQVLQELVPWSFPLQPCSTVSPPVRVQSLFRPRGSRDEHPIRVHMAIPLKQEHVLQ